MRNQRSIRAHSHIRRGISTLWLILVLPLFVTLLCVVADIGNVWLARVELETALESSALAAVKEWGDGGGGSTLAARRTGQLFAVANTVDGSSLAIGLNYDESKSPNQNESCDGNLLFGAIVTTNRPWVVDTRVTPNCSMGQVLIDATGQGNLGANNAWGVSFRATNSANLNSNLRIRRLVIDLDPGNLDQAHFSGSAQLSDDSQPAVRDSIGNEQPDNYGWNQTPPLRGQGPPSDQISFSFGKPSPACGNPRQLTIDFQAAGSDNGFEPGDRFRFGAGAHVRNNGGRFQQASGDEVGQVQTQVTVYFQLGAQDLPPVIANLADSGGRRLNCLNGQFLLDSLNINHLIVHEERIVDLPCPANASANPANNGQSRALLGSSELEYAVRAQASLQVRSLACQFLGDLFGPYSINAKATAVYDCASGRPRLIRVRPENFRCN